MGVRFPQGAFKYANDGGITKLEMCVVSLPHTVEENTCKIQTRISWEYLRFLDLFLYLICSMLFFGFSVT